jgi:drug/metabolite transporter (DMT)-like permease
MPDSTKGLLYAGFTAMLWGFLAIALKVSLKDLGPASIVWFRFFVAFIILLVILLLTDRTVFQTIRKPPSMVFLAAVFLGLNYFGFISGINLTSPSSAQVFIQVGPVSFAFAGIIIFKEKIRWKHLLGFLTLIIGFSLFYSEQVDLSGTEQGSTFLRGMIYVVLGGLSWAVFSILQKMMVKKWNPNHLNLIIYGFCSLAFLPFVEFSKFSSLNLNDWLLLIFLGLNTLLAYGSLALAFKYTEANKVSVIITLNPIITFVVMMILGSYSVSWIDAENFSLLSLIGAGIVFAGASLVIIRKRI